MLSITPVIVAAGGGRRMGTPKALASIDGKTFLEHILEGLVPLKIERPVVVIGAQAIAVRKRHRAASIQWIENRDWEQTDMFTSLQMALQILPAQHTALLWPVDAPLAAKAASLLVETVKNLHLRPAVNKKPTKCERGGVMGKERDAGDTAYRRSSVTPLIISKPSTVGDILFTAGLKGDWEALIPIFEGERGHPVLLTPSLVRHICEQEAGQTHLREILDGVKVEEVETQTPLTCLNLNTPQDIIRQCFKTK